MEIGNKDVNDDCAGRKYGGLKRGGYWANAGGVRLTAAMGETTGFYISFFLYDIT